MLNGFRTFWRAHTHTAVIFRVTFGGRLEGRIYVVDLAAAIQSTSRKVEGSIPDEVVRFFSWPNPSSRTMAMGST
jgi:hypothetical protein